MIQHIVLIRARKSAKDAQIQEIFDALATLVVTLQGAAEFRAGPSRSPEDYERGYTHGFSIQFETWEALRSYADNHRHKALGTRLIEICQDGLDGLLVVDLEG